MNTLGAFDRPAELQTLRQISIDCSMSESNSVSAVSRSEIREFGNSDRPTVEDQLSGADDAVRYADDAGHYADDVLRSSATAHSARSAPGIPPVMPFARSSRMFPGRLSSLMARSQAVGRRLRTLQVRIPVDVYAGLYDGWQQTHAIPEPCQR